MIEYGFKPNCNLERDFAQYILSMRYLKTLVILILSVLVLPVNAETNSQDETRVVGERIHRSKPPVGAKTHIVVPGKRFHAGWFKRWFYGSEYRNLWNTPIEIPVLDLEKVGGGLTPLRTGGFGQSISLHFTGKDGLRYTVRSLDKDPGRRLMDELKNTIAEDILQDMVSSLLPTGALVVDPLMEATGILYSKHTLVVIPDDPRLNEFRDQFAGLIGFLQIHPSEGENNTPGFAGSTQISGTDKLWEHLEKSPENRIDSQAYLKARLMDFLINDKDRHAGQWRWAKYTTTTDKVKHNWVVIPEDRDNAFVSYDGFAMWLSRRGNARLTIKFDEKFPAILGLTPSAWELDREFLVELNKNDWEDVVKQFCMDLPDAVIDDAVRKLPKPYYDLFGEELKRILIVRRDTLPEFAYRYYQMITRQVEIKGTDKDEYLHCEQNSNGDLVVRIGLIDKENGEKSPPYYKRTFHPNETSEVRVYLRGGDDHTEISGTTCPITLRIDGGGGDDTFINASNSGAAKVRFYDSRGKNQFEKGNGARINERPYDRPPSKITLSRYALDWGRTTFTFPVITTNPDIGVYVGGQNTFQYFGYRKHPYASRHTFGAGGASNGLRPFAFYTVNFRHILHNLDAKFHFKFSGIQMIRFNGFGNGTQIPESADFYKVEQSHFLIKPSLKYHSIHQTGANAKQRRSELTIRFGPILKYSNTSTEANADRYLGSLDKLLYGTGSFGQIGTSCEIIYDRRNNPSYTSQGFFLKAAGDFYPAVWDVATSFGNLDAEIRAYATAPIPTKPTLAIRVGGKNVWGEYPFHESTFLGGPGFAGIGAADGTIRGYRKNRFAGDASLYGNAELRLTLLPVKILVPGELGLFASFDIGRVFYEEDTQENDRWHNSYGGGLWLSFLDRTQTLSFSIIDGDDLIGLYLRAGFMF